MKPGKSRIGKKSLLTLTALAILSAPFQGSLRVYAETLNHQEWQTAMPNRPTGPVELLNYRTAQSQTFLNPNGTFTTKLYPSDVFFRDDNGHWQTIDYSLVSDGKGGYKNKLGPYSVDFPGTLANQGAISVQANPKNTLSMSLQNAAETQAATVTGNEIRYPNVLSGVDLLYNVLPHHIKESMVLQNASSSPVFSFLLHAPGVSFAASGHGGVIGKDGKGKTLFTIPAPFMTDAHGARSNAVTASLSVSAGNTVVTYTADATWLQSSAYPVVIDPSVGVTPSGQSAQETSIASGYPTTSYNTDTHFYAGYASGYGTLRGLLRFDNLPNLLPGASGATITNATLYVYQDSANTGGLPVSAFPITSPWQPANTTWSSQPSVGSTALDTQSQATSNISSTSPYVGTWSFNVTQDVQTVYSATSPNLGLELQAQNETSAKTDTWFASGTNATEPLPTLAVTYTVNPIGRDAAWMHSVDGVNFAGGGLTLPQTDLATGGLGPSVAVTRTFNSQNMGVNEGFGAGWSSNLFMHLTMDLPGPVLFTDATGLVHILSPIGNNSGTWVDAGAEHEYLVKNGDGSFTLYQSNGTRLQFTSSGKLSAIQTEAQNGVWQSVSFAYNTSGQLSTITDASGRIWNVTDNSSGLISQITDPDTRAANYSYTGSNLTSVTINPPSGSTGDAASTTSYAYSSTGPQFVVTDPNNNQTTYTWNTSGQVTSAADTVEGTAATNTYAWGTVSSGSNAGDSEVTVTDPTGHAVEYVTNADGNVMQTIVDPSGLAYTTNYTWDQNDDITGVTDPNGHSVSSVYNSNGDLVQFTDGKGKNSYFSFDGLDNPKGASNNNGSTGHTQYNGTLVTDSVDQAGNDTMVTYDANGNAIATTGPEGLGNNLAPNSDFAFKDPTTGLPVDWTYSTGTGISLDTNAADAIVGSTSLEISSTSVAGDQMNVSIPVVAGQTYNLSSYIKTNNVTADTHGLGAGISAHWFNSSGTDIQDQTGFINTTGTIAWTRKFGQLTAPAGAAYLQLECRLYGSGTVWFDGVQVEPVAYTPNQLLNSSFLDNTGNSTLPNNWPVTGFASGDALDNNNLHDGLPSLLINGGGSGSTKNFSQTISMPQYPIGGVLLSAWSKQSGASTTSPALYDVLVTVNYSDGTSATAGTATFSTTTTAWQHQTAPITLPAKSGASMKSVTVTGEFSNQSTAAQAWFNDLELKVLPQTSSFSAYNYVQNPGFLFDYQGNALPDDWTDLATDTGTPSWSTTESYGDNNALQIHPSTNLSATEKVANDSLAPYQSGANYTAVAYIHTEGLANDSAYIEIQALDASGNVLGVFDSGKVGHATADANGNVAWTHVIVNAPASSLPSGTANVRVVLAQNGDPSGGAGNGNSYFDDIRLSTTDLSTHSTYDSKGNYVTSVTDPMGNTTTMTPNTNTGFVTSITDPLNNTTSFTSNKFDETASTTLPASGGTFNYGYDASGNLTTVTDPNGHSVTYGYNELGQAKTFSETVNGANQVTGIHHNGNGQVTGIDMPNTTSTVISYNTANQPTAVSYWNSGGKQDQWNFGFDGVGNLTSMQDQSATSPTTYGYDANNQLTSVTEPVTGGSNTEQFTLDPNGNPTISTVQLGSSTGPSWSLGNAWDIAGNLRSVTDGSQTQYFEYDDHGNVVKSTDSATGQAEYFSYNPDQQVSRVTFKGNSTTGNANDLSYLYDADGRITKITNNTNAPSITFTYNSIGELTLETTWDGRTIAYTYDNVGNRTSMSVTQNGTTTTTTYGYNTEKNRLTSITVGSNPAQTVTFDGAGNTLSDGTNTYTWNAAGQLASVTHGGTTYNYTYDGLDRRVTNSVSGYTYHYNGQSTQIAYITDANNNLVARFSYGAANGPAYMTLASGK
ncbi:MAG: DNRLRE domain-containing protein, partial [Bacilli bacterium]